MGLEFCKLILIFSTGVTIDVQHIPATKPDIVELIISLSNCFVKYFLVEFLFLKVS